MQPNLKKNYLYRVFYEIVVLATPFVTTPYVSRVLGADGVGNYSYTCSIVSYFMLFGALGTASYGEREIAQHRNDPYEASRLFWEIEIMTIITSGVCLIFWIGVILFSVKYRFYYIILTPFIFSTMFDITWFFTGYEMVGKIVARNTILRLSGIILTFAMVHKKEDILIYCGIYSITTFLGNLSLWFYLPGMLKKVDLKRMRIKKHFHETIVYFIPAIATSIYTVLDKTLIGIITSDSYQNGFYEQATKIIRITNSFVFSAVNSVMGARMSYLFYEKHISEIKARISKSMNFIYFCGVGAMFGIIGIAPVFVPLFFGDGFNPVENLLYVMSPLILVIGTSNCLGSQYYTPSGQRKRSAKFIISGALINLFLNILFIPYFGAIGASVASLAAELSITILYVMKSNGYMKWGMLWRFVNKRLIAGGTMCILVRIIGSYLNAKSIVILFIQIISGVATYTFILFLFKDDILQYLFDTATSTINRIRNSNIRAS